MSLAIGSVFGLALAIRVSFKTKDQQDLAWIRALSEQAARVQQAQDEEARRRGGLPVPAFTPPPVVPVSALHPLSGSSLTPIPGKTYHVTVDVSFPTSLAASASSVAEQARDAGFTRLSVSRSKPQGWPGKSGDYYVTGVYSGSPKTVQRSYLGGQVKITDVWEEG